jgi:hypothetical protein
VATQDDTGIPFLDGKKKLQLYRAACQKLERKLVIPTKEGTSFRGLGEKKETVNFLIYRNSLYSERIPYL